MCLLRWPRVQHVAFVQGDRRTQEKRCHSFCVVPSLLYKKQRVRWPTQQRSKHNATNQRRKPWCKKALSVSNVLAVRDPWQFLVQWLRCLPLCICSFQVRRRLSWTCCWNRRTFPEYRRLTHWSWSCWIWARWSCPSPGNPGQCSHWIWSAVRISSCCYWVFHSRGNLVPPESEDICRR